MTMTRRQWLTHSMVLGATLSSALVPGESQAQVSVANAVSDSGPEPLPAALNEPQGQLRHLVRMQGSLREQDVPWWFTGVIFAVTGDQATPQPLVRFEGLEVYWFEHVEDGYRLGGHTVTFFRDYASGEYLYEFANPWTGQTDVVKPAVQGGNLGFAYTKEGIWPVRLDGRTFEEPRRAPLRLQWHAAGEHVWLQHQTVYPPGVPPMHGQRQTMFASRAAFFDDRLDMLPSTFSSTVFMGWLKWMNMAEHPGHVIWHASGAKLSSIEQLPRAFLDRARREHPERLSARPSRVKTAAP
jgi:hypothetical protein